MANPQNHAQKQHDHYEAEVKPYLYELFMRLGLNYGLLTLALLLIRFLIAPLAAQIIPESIIGSLLFALILLVWLFGWRFLEKRNQATSLYFLYSRFSRQRRDLETLLKTPPDNPDNLYAAADLVEEAAQNFLKAAQDAGLKPRVEKDA
jgi:hypothetical protein